MKAQMLPGCYFGVHGAHQGASVGLEGWHSLICVHPSILPVVQADYVSHHHQASFLDSEKSTPQNKNQQGKKKEINKKELKKNHYMWFINWFFF